MPAPTFNGYVVAINGEDGDKRPQGYVIELSGDALIHASGAYIRFSPEGDIFIVPAQGRTAILGRDDAD
jgi:hypothetical protein